MTKEEIISKVKALNLPRASYIVFGAAPMTALGIREANDIDLLVSKEIYQKLRNKGWKQIIKGPNDTPLVYDVFEAHDNWNFSSYSPTLKDLLENAFEVGGISFASIDDVRKWKAASSEPKHIADVKLIDSYIERNNADF